MTTNSKEYNKKNYKKYWGSADAIKDRSSRNQANRMKNPWPWKEVHHKDWNPRNNAKSNLSVVKRTTNRKDGAKKANGK